MINMGDVLYRNECSIFKPDEIILRRELKWKEEKWRE
jgi:hypothetical protein